MTPNKTDHDSPPEETGSGSDWGADWEEAFQAEEDAMFSLEEGEQQEFFKQARSQSKTKGIKAEGIAAPDSETDNTVAARSFPAILIGLLITAGHTFFAFLKKFYTSPLLLHRLAAYGLPLLICSFFLYSLLKPVPMPTLAPGVPPPLAEAPHGSFDILEKTALPEPSAARPSVTTPAPGMSPGEKVRKKWEFATFMIPAAPEEDASKISFVTIDLTLVTLSAADAPLPEEKKIFVRDIIYQFYANRPLYELRRFSLARGEMSRKLRAWLQKQWPELPLESIVFQRYEVS